MIQLKNVSKYYYSKGMIASGISKVNLTLDTGEFVVITGESGSGKSTLLNVISGLDSYEDGEMYINGEETSHYLAADFEEYRKKYIGNIFQNFNLVNSYTVYQNVELILLINGYKKAEIKKRIADILDRVGLSEFASTKVSKLSGGQKQRVSIARALAKDTEIIVADEPTGNLDSKSAEGIAELLSEISKDKLVIVVTHNFDQFEPYATRRIKMHDGKIAEDDGVRSPVSESPVEIKVNEENRSESRTGNISVISRVRLGIRNTFNIFHKFLLLLMVFVFVVLAVTSEYTTFNYQKEEMDKLGWNDYFWNYSENRIVLKKSDGSQFRDADYNAISNAKNVSSIAPNDILLDRSIYIEDENISYEAYPRTVDEFDGKLVMGRMPQKRNEVILTGYKDDYYFSEQVMSDIIDRKYTIYFDDGRETRVRIVGLAYKDTEKNGYMYSGDIYMTSDMIGEIRKGVYNAASSISITINDKIQSGDESYYNIAVNKNVDEGEACVPEDVNNYFRNGHAQGEDIKLTAKNIFYKKSVTLDMMDIYTEKNFETLTGYKDFDNYYGTIFISQKDYNKLFLRENYQASVYVSDVKTMDQTLKALEDMGYVTLPLKDILINGAEGIADIIQVPIAVIIVVALFFIAYFVIRLILKSRAGYFSILRMLGLARKNIRRIMDIELVTVTNIAYLIFLGLVVIVKEHVVHGRYINYIDTMIEYMNVSDYVVLYIVLIIMALLISGKFARSLFKKTALGSFREED
ncbi:MAG: ATP-binding cassette domain-containing protein [Firmicutes bacterium]|nr:ATP-binding cassette domain-containing protein [Bacillota bacterium]